jgi:hypothetical protein
MKGSEPPARWEEVDAVLSAALERPPGERLRFVRERTIGDPQLGAAVEDLLAAGDAARSFLERPIDFDADELLKISNQLLAHWRRREQGLSDPPGG